ncbi:hypothetical protein VNO80_22977 [Phaseolus coccineus]|uniref:Uncharacterized protein n=1 Tax=Phaseolus coccineus TaxID=3886 RepID=A0AAN9M5X3_PHACN
MLTLPAKGLMVEAQERVLLNEGVISGQPEEVSNDDVEWSADGCWFGPSQAHAGVTSWVGRTFELGLDLDELEQSGIKGNGSEAGANPNREVGRLCTIVEGMENKLATACGGILGSSVLVGVVLALNEKDGGERASEEDGWQGHDGDGARDNVGVRDGDEVCDSDDVVGIVDGRWLTVGESRC